MYTTKNQNKSYSNNICQKESDPVAQQQQQQQQQQRRRSVSLLKQLLYILHMYNKKGAKSGSSFSQLLQPQQQSSTCKKI